jgi:cytidylate kinase
VLVVALDGPAGTGKSTVARAVAERLGLAYLDTGAMYRAVTWAARREGLVDAAGTVVGSATVLGDLVERLDLTLDATSGRVTVDGTDVTAAIRGPEVTAAVSAVSAVPEVRAVLRPRQRALVTEAGGGVVEGRDMGTVVFPDATLKVYLTARPEVRAQRRAAEAGGDVVAVAADMARRDLADSSRADSPLSLATDALVVDTSDLSIEQVVEQVAGEARVRAGMPGCAP